ncbi:transgelin 2 [Chrysochromulina tobinii]|uniref:Transgelin 2 n=1 Tax=Chrysochromulina tobinii TaxID=1460289 RepID=A0A0M0J625_9EUKA|nr:transgelin 2 [Chrysochromulina tobinii]|eukprot:KOO21673.1 transgelin 2 [Chrysochromulina sp. CCMP291]
MIEAMSDLLRDPARSSLVWLLAQPTKHERALLMLYASRAPTARPSEPMPARVLVHGTLHLFLSHAVGLKALDNNGKSDPYVKFSLAGKEVKSKVISKNLNPRWGEVFTFKGVLKDFIAAPLQLRCKDKDTFSSDKLGDASIDLGGLARTDVVELQARLSTQGTIYLRAAWQADGKPSPPGSLTADVPAASSPPSSAPSTPIAAATYWVATVTSCVPPQMVGETAPDESALHAWLRSGERLCQLVNVLRPGSVGRIAKSEMPFKQMENIDAYLRACLQLGVPQQDLFTTPDLFNAKSMGAVG